MQSRRIGIGVAVAALAAAVGLFFVLRDEEPEPAPTQPAAEDAPEPGPEPDEPERAEPQVPTVVMRGGEPVGGVAELSFQRGEQIEFIVRSDTPEELHLHGYDLVRHIDAGGRARFDLEAEFEGAFELETHPGQVTVARLTVRP